MKQRETLTAALTAILMMAAVLAMAAMAPLGADPQTAPAAGAHTPSAGLVFSTRIEGRKIPDDLRIALSDAIELGKGKAPPPPTLGLLRRRANEDAARLVEVLRSEAYYNGRAEPVVQEARGGHFEVIYNVTLGPRTMIGSFTILYSGNPADAAALPRDGAALGLKPGRAARAQRIIDLTAQALTFLADHGHPEARLIERKVIVDLAAHKADVTLTIDAGPQFRFGPISIENKGRTKDDYVQSFAAFRPGDIYDRGKADKMVSALRETGLFDQVALVSGEAEDGALPQRLTLGERAMRSAGLGASWSSDEGAGVRSFWEHRNLMGRGEKLRLELMLAQIEQMASAEFRKPRFLREDQSLLGGLEIAHEDTDAYEENRIKTTASILRRLRPTLEAGAGLSFEYTHTKDSTGNHTYQLFGLPLILRYDGSDDLLDPAQGSRLGLSLTPYAGRSGTPVSFARFEATGSTYLSFGARPDVTLAARGRFGSTLAERTFDIPGSIRFYAGGGGSIRGYGYQLVGPLGADNKPLGGRSVVEASGELRYRASRDIGLVAFIDGGNAYATSTPKFSEPLRWGAGLGLRYYTAIGPVRADVAVPLNRRPGIDDAFQIYVSLGQAF